MSFYRVQVEVPRDTLIPADVAVMTWHIKSNDVSPSKTAELDDIFDKMQVFYDAIDNNFSSTCGTTWTYTGYDLEDPEPRVPIRSQLHTATPGTTFLPSEVAICLSMQADPVSGLNQRRRRGRVFLGPLSQLALELANAEVRISSVTRTAVVNAAAAFLPEFVGAVTGSTMNICVFSRADFQSTGSLLGSFHEVQQFYVDDAYDIQRRRGVAPTTRTQTA